MSVRLLAAVFAAGLAAAVPSPAGGAPGLLVGVTEDMFKLEPTLTRSVASDLGLGAARVSLNWNPGQTALAEQDAALVQNALSTGVRVVLAVYGGRDSVPRDAAAREAYCSYVRAALARFPQIDDVVIWNEPNLSYFWRPQFDAAGRSVSPSAYAELLARCWDVLHGLRPTVNVIAPATSPWGFDDPAHWEVISHSPTSFIRALAAAYRATGRDRPIFDTVGHHVYGSFPGERPWRRHASWRRISQGDLDKLVAELQAGFGGTAQGVPGRPTGARVVPVWYMEAGFDTQPDPEKRHLYVNAEPTAAIPDSVGAAPWTTLPDADSPAPDQATQLRDALRFAACQPYVGAFFNFLLRDQENLIVWQSGVLWADRTPKGSYAAFKEVVGEVTRGAVDCRLFGDVPAQQPALTEEELLPAPPPGASGPTAPLGGSLAPKGTQRHKLALVRVVWLRHQTYSRKHADWSIAVRATRAARYRAVISRGGRVRLEARGRLRARRLTHIRFPRRALAPGRYRVVLRLETAPPAAEALKVRSAPFRVRPGAVGRGRANR